MEMGGSQMFAKRVLCYLMEKGIAAVCKESHVLPHGEGDISDVCKESTVLAPKYGDLRCL